MYNYEINSNYSTSELPQENLYPFSNKTSNSKIDENNMDSPIIPSYAKNAYSEKDQDFIHISCYSPIKKNLEKDNAYDKKRKDEENKEFNTIYKKCKSLNTFKILDECGEGTFGNVILIYNEYEQSKMAMKFHKGNNSIKNMIRENKILETFMNNESFKTLIKYYGPYKDDDKNKQIMLGIEAGEANLQELIKARKECSNPYTLEEIVYLINLLFQNLCEIHKLNIFHSDIKPSNIILIYQNSEITYKLTDFGLSLILSKKDVEIPCESLLGHTRGYYPPESEKMNKFNPWKFDYYSLAKVFSLLLNDVKSKDDSFDLIDNLVKKYINCSEQNRKYFGELLEEIKLPKVNILYICQLFF